jgi:hypothetical protein
LNAINLFQSNFVAKNIRLIGIKLDNLMPNEITLFSNEIYEDFKTLKQKEIIEEKVIHDVNKKFNKKILDLAINKFK